MLRRNDRGWFNPLKKLGTDEVNSKQLIQPDLNDLYTSIEMPADYLYAQLFTSLWAIMSFSGGLTILYPIGALNFIILYWVYKTLLVKYYSKTTMFDQVLPLSTILFFKVSVIMHVIMNIFIFSNQIFSFSQSINNSLTS